MYGCSHKISGRAAIAQTTRKTHGIIQPLVKLELPMAGDAKKKRASSRSPRGNREFGIFGYGVHTSRARGTLSITMKAVAMTQIGRTRQNTLADIIGSQYALVALMVFMEITSRSP